jgi:mono/diheme cytochrome c family protein
MKQLIIAAACIALIAGLWSCTAHGNDPGRAYMPDMYYSRAYETYGYNDVDGEYDTLAKRGINYTALPVPGTVARGDMLSYHLTSDSAGMKIAETLKNPLDSVKDTKEGMVEAERLFLVNCAICHGPQLDGNGPLYNNGNGPYPVQPKPLNGDYAKGLSDGHIFHVITYGIRSMGSYASQLRPEQRWWVIKYIRMKEGGGGTGGKDTANVITSKSAQPEGAVLPANGKTK